MAYDRLGRYFPAEAVKGYDIGPKWLGLMVFRLADEETCPKAEPSDATCSQKPSRKRPSYSEKTALWIEYWENQLSKKPKNKGF